MTITINKLIPRSQATTQLINSKVLNPSELLSTIGEILKDGKNNHLSRDYLIDSIQALVSANKDSAHQLGLPSEYSVIKTLLVNPILDGNVSSTKVADSVGGVSASQLDKIIEFYDEWEGTKWLKGGDSKNGIDCSHFVAQAYRAAGIDYDYLTTTGDWEKAGFEVVDMPQPGDLILWEPLPGESYGHVGIVADPENKKFIGAQRTKGVSEASYEKGHGQGLYWGNRKFVFLRYKG